MKDTGLADRLRAKGLNVVEVDGWQTRQRPNGGDPSFQGSVNHHTAGAPTGNAPSLGICINGRAGLPGPLCNVLQARDNTCYVIAAGVANHAGSGGWRGLSGNYTVHGLEVENVGTGDEPWRDDQLLTMAKVHAAFLEGSSLDPELNCQHKEWTSAKIDAVDIDGDTFRTLVRSFLYWTPPPTDEGDLDVDEATLRRIIQEELEAQSQKLIQDETSGWPKAIREKLVQPGVELMERKLLEDPAWVDKQEQVFPGLKGA